MVSGGAGRCPGWGGRGPLCPGRAPPGPPRCHRGRPAATPPPGARRSGPSLAACPGPGPAAVEAPPAAGGGRPPALCSRRSQAVPGGRKEEGVWGARARRRVPDITGGSEPSPAPCDAGPELPGSRVAPRAARRAPSLLVDVLLCTSPPIGPGGRVSQRLAPGGTPLETCLRGCAVRSY